MNLDRKTGVTTFQDSLYVAERREILMEKEKQKMKKRIIQKYFIFNHIAF